MGGWAVADANLGRVVHSVACVLCIWPGALLPAAGLRGCGGCYACGGGHAEDANPQFPQLCIGILLRGVELDSGDHAV